MTNILQHVDSITRRTALRHLIMFPALSLTVGTGITQPQERQIPGILSQRSASVTACRELGKGKDSSDLALAFKGVSTYLIVLKSIMRDSQQYRRTSANIAAQCCRVKATLAWHVENIQYASRYSQEAVEYAREAKDPALLISTLISQAWACYYDRRYDDGIKALGEAIPTLKSLPGSVAVHVWSTLAVLETRNGEDGMTSLRQAHKMLNKEMHNDYFTFSDGMTPELTGNEALTYYHAGNHEKAMDTFSQLIDPESLSVKIPLSGKAHVEMLNFMASASLKKPKKEMEQTIALWEAGLNGAKSLGSKQRFSESLGIYDTMESVWTGEQGIKDLRKQLVFPRE